jgi:hypothetical protein
MLKSVTAAACLCATMAQAQSSTLTGQQINELVAGATVEIDTPVGTKLPVRYGRDGKLAGEARDLASYLGAAFDRGRWWVASDRLCHKWNRWFNSEPQCMRLSKEGRLIRWSSQDGHSGTAIIAVPPTIQAGAVLPSVQPDLAKRIAPPEMLPAPASPPEKQTAETIARPNLPSQHVAEEQPVPPPPAKAPPAPAPQRGEEPEHPAEPLFRVVNVRTDDVLNVRSGPSADFGIVGGLAPGSRGIAITNACRSRWCPVQRGSTSGWVNSLYLAPEELSRTLRDAPEARGR